jgi:uncharacterized protein YdhG (YjbR/CyaY superfamily)
MKKRDEIGIDEYIAQFPIDVQKLLEKIRSTVKQSAPSATEAMKYRIPTFVLNSTNLVHFAAFKNHIGFYPTPSGVEAFKDEFAVYKASKGAVQFPLDAKIPTSLIKRVVQFRVREVNQKNNSRSSKKK